ncbi:hypothetical protein ACN265_32180 [Micromonospora sp. WMMD730]|uniref:hypothetical protein n=1 Tax=Micromonospora sp. WMMD730 TaxID=3404128 RepID=UPI003B94E484
MSTVCTCPARWRRLYTVIEGVRYRVEPATANTATSLLFRAWCASCGAEYGHPFRLDARDLNAA